MTRAPQIEGVRDLVEIGRGGFGVVYRGTELEFGREVAVKVLTQLSDDRARRRFDRERRAMGAVSDHDNIVTVYRGGLTPNNEPYLVMEYLRGGSLSDRLQHVGPMDWRRAAEIGAKMGEALTVAHRAGILHRDVKPGNIFLTDAGEPKLGDFGIAVLDDGNVSRTGTITASVAHAPPEIVDGQPGDERSDLYSLASTVYALANGAAPFSRTSDESLSSLLSRLANDDPRPLHLESAAAPFEKVVLKGLSKRPDDRHDTVAQFGNELLRAAANTADIPQPNVPAATPPANPATPPGFRQPVALVADPQELSAPADEPNRAVSTGQLGFFAVLLLAIAAFGGWAVSKAVFAGDDDPVAASTFVPTPVATVEAPPEPAPTRRPRPTAAPTPSPVPVPTPAPQPDEPTGGGEVDGGEEEEDGEEEDGEGAGGGLRGSPLVPSGFSRVSDFSGSITVSVPTEWTSTTQDLSDLGPEGEALRARTLAVGATLNELAGGPEARNFSRSGIYVFAARVDGNQNADGVLEVSLDNWTDCEYGDESAILLTNGNAPFQILQCEHDGLKAGVTVFGMVPREDITVGVTIVLQFADFDDLDALPMILESLLIDTERLPLAET